VEFVERRSPEDFPVGGTSREEWPSLFYSNLIRNFVMRSWKAPESQGDFAQGALVANERINAFERSHLERRWINFNEVRCLEDARVARFDNDRTGVRRRCRTDVEKERERSHESRQ